MPLTVEEETENFMQCFRDMSARAIEVGVEQRVAVRKRGEESTSQEPTSPKASIMKAPSTPSPPQRKAKKVFTPPKEFFMFQKQASFLDS